MSDDALATAATIKEIVADGKNIVLVAHSYGGIPATQSLKYLAKTDPNKGRVRKLVYLSAVVVPVGNSSTDSISQLPDFLTVQGDYIDQEPTGNAKLTFSDLPYEEALTWAKQMPSHSMLSFKEPLDYAGYRDVSVAYIICEEDMIIPVPAQEAMIQFLREQVEVNVDVHRLQSGHCPNASQPKQLADLMRQIIDTA